MQVVRQPIVAFLGHVDHGKTTILDMIRNTSVQRKEKGAITQHIGASEVPAEVIANLGSALLKKMNIKIHIPGLLFIDTPGHEAFTSLRKRGGSIADIAVLVVDATQGVQKQTIESLNILKEYKTPFIVAMNKVDLVQGWKPQPTKSILESLASQPQPVLQHFETKFYELVGQLAEQGFNCERFDKVSDYTKEISIIPISGVTGEGLAELLIIITGLSQKYLAGSLYIDENAKGEASIIEVKEETGLGKTLDVILYNGTIKVGDKAAFATFSGHEITHIRALLKPKPLTEMRDTHEKFNTVDFVSAAAGVKIAAPNLDDAIPGSTLYIVDGENDPVVTKIDNEVQSILSLSGEGVLIKADALGSLEAAIRLLSDAGIPVGRVGIGNVSRKDVVEASVLKSGNKYNGAILAFNVKTSPHVREYSRHCKIPIFESGVIYALVDEYFKWKHRLEDEEKRNVFDKLQPIGKVRVLPGCCFRVSKPMICGIKVEIGKIRPGAVLIDEGGSRIGQIKGIQEDRASVSEAKEGAEVAVSVDGCTFGKDVVERKILYTYVSKSDGDLYLEKYNKLLSEKELTLLVHILRITKQKLV